MRSLLDKRRALWYPEGQQIGGVLLEYERKHRYNPETVSSYDFTTRLEGVLMLLQAYIQSIELHPEFGLIIVCMTKQQALIWTERKEWEVDMSFKRVRQRDLNEVLFASYLAELGKTHTHCRAFMQAQSAEAYAHMFKTCFEHVERLTGRKIKWHFKDGEGWEAVIGDMDCGQYKGI